VQHTHLRADSVTQYVHKILTFRLIGRKRFESRSGHRVCFLNFGGFDCLCGLVVRVPGYRSRSLCYQILWRFMGLERGPLSLVRITEELLEWKSSDSGLQNEINGRENPLHWPRDNLYPLKLGLKILLFLIFLVGVWSPTGSTRHGGHWLA
jgi:hypothetical protein